LGLEALCPFHYRGRSVEGKAHLATEAVELSGEIRLTIPFKEITSVEARGGKLKMRFAGEEAVLDLGPQAEKWALKIRYPKGRLDKLGIKPGSQVCLLGVQDEDFRTELAERTREIFEEPREGADFILFQAGTQESLEALATLQSYIKRDGAIWVLWPKGQRQITRDHVFAASHAAGLVDIKICAFSDTLSGLKMVIPRDRR
jgi:hypothetical protein